jgi:N-acyl-D-amino-acid deacylase
VSDGNGSLTLDLVLRNGYVIDGSGNPWFRADVGIENGRTDRIGNLKGTRANKEIDVSGLVVSPGFIDIHSHSDFSLVAFPKAESKIMQGVTTEVIGNCGISAAPLRGVAREWAERYELRRFSVRLDWSTFAEYLGRLERQGVAVNVVPLVGHGTVRLSVMGYESREPTEGEMEEMKSLVRSSMEEGAFGMSSGLVYAPGSYSTTEELVELCRIVSEYDGIYTSHIRGERETLLDAVREAIEIGEKASVPVQVSHHDPKFPAWGSTKEYFRIEEEARARGVDVTCDVVPSVENIASFHAFLPYRSRGLVLTDEEVIEMIEDPTKREKLKRDMVEDTPPGPGPFGIPKHGRWDLVTIVQSEKNKDLIGKSNKRGC